MNEEHFLIQFIPSKHCFLQFSNKWFQKINNPKTVCLKLVHQTTKEELRFTWAPQPSFGLNDCSVGINATFAQGLNLHENELVVISSEETLTSLGQVFLTPLSADDYEILEMSRENVEVSLLNQIRIVFLKEVITVWVSKTMHLKLTVDRLEPRSSFGRLEQLTELVIEDVNRTNGIKPHHNAHVNYHASPSETNTKDKVQSPSESSFWGLLSDYLPGRVVDLLRPSESKEIEQSSQIIDNTHLVCRVHPFPSSHEQCTCCNSVHHGTFHPFNVFIHKTTLENNNFWPKNTFVPSFLHSRDSVMLCRLEALNFKVPTQKNNSSDGKSKESDEATCVIVRLYRIEDSCQLFKRTNVSCAYLSHHLRKLLSISVGSKVRFTVYSPPLNILLTDITLIPDTDLSESEAEAVQQQFIEQLPTHGSVLINNLCPFPVQLAGGSQSSMLVQLSPEKLDCWPLTRPELQVCSLSVITKGAHWSEDLSSSTDDKENVPLISSVFENLVEEGVATLKFGLQLVEVKNQNIIVDNILITGKQGSGKSTLASAIYTKVSDSPHHVHVVVVDCRPLKGKKPESVLKVVAEHLEKCINFQPSVLVLDDLPCIAGVPINNMEPSQETNYFLRLATVLKELLWRVRVSQCVSVIATAESRARVHPQLLSARGRHAFTTFLNIPALHKNNRLKLLNELLKSKVSIDSTLDLEGLAEKTDGYSARDLNQLVERVLFKACQRQTQAEIQLTTNDLEKGLEGFVPSELLNVSLVRHTTHSFADVGGLLEAKRALTEVLIWPTKYPDVFKHCPLRLERGALLYGAPGTGKTLLANAVVGESGLNLITVKGPELLSKYIGASEEAVRNVFQKAQSAQPCILFFDEFDSLAPRRGHDSTGVTDRVVNQLLTQMDGVEALEGVWVVAAASRPDLLDPALLRPGRIGSLVYCPLPDEIERLEILESLSRKLRLSSDVDLKVIAAKTNNFTGADLHAVLFTAQMTAYEALYQDSDGEDDELQALASTPMSDVEVSMDNLVVALKNTSPSLKPEDRLRFQLIYQRFQTNREGTSSSLQDQTSQKVTLA